MEKEKKSQASFFRLGNRFVLLHRNYPFIVLTCFVFLSPSLERENLFIFVFFKFDSI